MKRFGFFGFVVAVFVLRVAVLADDHKIRNLGSTFTIEQTGLVVHIIKEGFRYSFRRPDGSVIVEPHGISGMTRTRTGGPINALAAVHAGLPYIDERFFNVTTSSFLGQKHIPYS